MKKCKYKVSDHFADVSKMVEVTKIETMQKTAITPSGSTYPLPIPSCYVGKRVEVLLYSGDELLLESKAAGSKKPSDFFGTLSAAEGEEFHSYVANARLECGY